MMHLPGTKHIWNGETLARGAKRRKAGSAIGLFGRIGGAAFNWSLSIAGSLLLASPIAADFSHSSIKLFCSPDLMGSEPFARVIQGRDGALYGTTLTGGGRTEGTVFRLAKIRDRTDFVALHSFTGTSGDGATPYGDLIEGADGVLYGTTRNGGSGQVGTVFKVNQDGSGYTVLHSFSAGGEQGSSPSAGMIEGSDGGLYGTTHLGGAANLGTVFSVKKDGTGFRVLHSFSLAGGQGVQPTAGVIQASDGALYGTTHFGGTSNLGTIFKLNLDGTDFRVLRSFTGGNQEGGSPYGGLLEGSDGALYGTTIAGGSANLGTVFKLNKDGTGWRTLRSLTGTPADGARPYGALVEGADGALHGAATVGGSKGDGALFKLNKDGSGYRLIYSFLGEMDGSMPYAGLSKGPDGRLYGATAYGGNNDFGTVFELNQDGGSYRVLHRFANGGDGLPPHNTLLEASDGALLGTSWDGGSKNAGAVFRVNKDGSGYGVMHSFTGGGDGVSPYGALIEGSDGVIYGTTVAGGVARSGTVFRINRDGADYRLLHSFDRESGGATQPYGGVVEGTDGALYGLAAYGGSEDRGALFKLNKDGSGFSVLHQFTGDTEVKNPYASLTRGGDRTLYGASPYGGTKNAGTVFRINEDGSGYRVLHHFTNSDSEDGQQPFAALLDGSDGALYGTTVFGGATNLGTVFKVGKDGSGYRVLHHFTGTEADGGQPGSGARLVEGNDGALYGTAYSGGNAGVGAVFKLNKDGSGFRLIYSFTGLGGEGSQPFAGLRKASDGAFYGTSMGGGLGCGTVFKMAPMASLSITATGDLRLTGPSGYRFTLQYLEDLTSSNQWQDLASVILAPSQSVALFPAFSAAQRRFYRAVLAP